MIVQSLGGMKIVMGMSSLTGGLVLDKSELVQGSELPVRATLPSALNMINASSVGKLVQLVTASRLILNHKGRIDPMKDECHYQVKH